jgi:uracil-DNA glycosylase
LPGQRPPPSLKNIYNELFDDPDVEFPTIPNHGNLSRWAYQGVLLLNTLLTVRKGEANSHKGQGWEELTDELIRIVDRRCKNVVFLLWGAPALKKALTILGKNGNNKTKHTIITCSHPSPLGARKTKTPFLGSRCFSRCNRALIDMGHTPINWEL